MLLTEHKLHIFLVFCCNLFYEFSLFFWLTQYSLGQQQQQQQEIIVCAVVACLNLALTSTSSSSHYCHWISIMDRKAVNWTDTVCVWNGKWLEGAPLSCPAFFRLYFFRFIWLEFYGLCVCGSAIVCMDVHGVSCLSYHVRFFKEIVIFLGRSAGKKVEFSGWKWEFKDQKLSKE